MLYCTSSFSQAVPIVLFFSFISAQSNLFRVFGGKIKNAGHLEMTGKQINLKNRKTNRLLAHTILRFYGSTLQNGQTVTF